MTDERLQKIKSAVESADHLSAWKKSELLAVLAKLKPAIAEIAQNHESEAERISQFALSGSTKSLSAEPSVGSLGSGAQFRPSSLLRTGEIRP